MANPKKQNTYEQIVKHVIQEGKGYLVTVTQDALFVKTVKGALKSMGVDKETLKHRHDLDKALADAKNLQNRYEHLIFLIEANIEGVNNILNLKHLKTALGDKCKAIVTTSETDRNNIIHMYEMGADNVIVKPVSVNSLIQKIALTLNPNSKLAEKVDEAKAKLGENQLEQAEKVVQEILDQKPDSAIAFILKGDIAKKRKDFETAEEYYFKSAKQSKMYLEPLKKLVELYSESNNLEKKLDYLKKLDKLSPLNHERKIELGDTHLALDNEKEAKRVFDQAVKQVQKQARDLLSSTLMHIAKKVRDKRPDLSSQYVAQAIEQKGSALEKDDIWMFNEIGIDLRSQGKWEEAIKYYRQGLEVSPMDGGLYYNMGMAYAQGKQYFKALENFQKAMEVRPEILTQYPSVPYNIAKVYIALNKREDAVKYLKKALSINPGYENAKKLLAKIAG